MLDAVTRTVKALLPRQSVSSSTSDPANSPSLSQLVSTLVPALAFAGLYMGFFLIFRSRIPHAYAPRTYLGSLRPQERSEPLPMGMFNWIVAFFKMSDKIVLNRQSLDGFLLLRYLKISVALCFFGVLITWPILMPINATGGGGQTQLNVISFSNIMDSNNRYYAHAFVAWVFFGLVFYMVMRESIYYINLRQAYLISPLYANRVSSRTVLFTSVPVDYQKEHVLRRVLGKHVKNIWIASDCEQLGKLVEERDKVAMKLEAAETRLIKTANKVHRREAKAGVLPEEPLANGSNTDDESGSVAARWVQPKQRPTHHLRFLIGRKVDTIHWCRSELERLTPKVEAMQNKFRAGEGKPICSVFAEYYTQTEAQAAFQSLTHHQPLHMAPRFIGVNPEEVIWENLKISWASRVIRNIATTGFVIALILFWAIPVAFVGTLSNIQALTEGDPTADPPQGPLLPWLSFINNIPSVILGVVQGLLPSVLLALLMALLPPFLRWMAKLSGKPSLASVELRVQNTYFLFQVIQVFLITTITSGASASIISIINEPSAAPSLLAQDLPKASNFYISYFILQGLAIASGALANVFGVLLFMVLSKIFDTTPRMMYKRYIELSGLGWGTEFPAYTLLTVIAITYSVIAPLVLGFATVGLYLIYLAYSYNLLFVFNADVDTKGLVYARALQQTTTGCYLGIVCLIGLFVIKAAIGPLILMIILLVIVTLWHFSLSDAIDPLLNYLPKSLQVEEESLLALEDGQQQTTQEEEEEEEEDDDDDDDDKRDGDDKEAQVSGLSDPPNSKTPSPTPPNGTNSNPSRPPKARPPLKRRRTFPARPNLLTKFLFPHTHSDYHSFRRLVPRDFLSTTTYPPEIERDAYFHPAIKAEVPTLWIPRDEMGVSRQECLHSGKVIGITDEGAGFDAKGRMVWDREEGGAEVPVREEKIYY